MNDPDLATTITAAALVPANLAPTVFNVSGVSVRYLPYVEALERVVEAFEQDRASFIGYFVPYTRSGMRQSFPQLESVKVQWNDGPKRGGAFYHTQELSLGEWALPGYVRLGDRVVHAGDASAKESFIRHWRGNSSFATIGGPGAVRPADVAEGKIWAGLKVFRVFYLRKGRHPVYFGEDRYRHHPEPEPYWSFFDLKAESDEEFSQLFKL